MLRQLLQLAVERGSVELTELAQVLGTSPEMVQQMIESLQREGYLHSVVQGCQQPCERCPLKTACLYRRHPRIWALTEKGARWLAQSD